MDLTEKVVLIDIDGTLTREECWTPEQCLAASPITPMIDKVNELYQKNFVVIYTARRDENIPATLEWLRRNNVRFHAWSNQKTAGDIYVDDKSIQPHQLVLG